MFKNLATIVEVFGDIGVGDRCTTIVRWSPLVVRGRRNILVTRIAHWSPTSSTTIVRWSASGRRLLEDCPKLPVVVGDQLRLGHRTVSDLYDMSLREVADKFPILHKCRGFTGLDHSTINFWFVQVPMRLCLENFHQISKELILISL